MGKPKLPLQRIEADSCVVTVGRVIEGDKITDVGKPMKVHEGEWIEIIPTVNVQEYLAKRSFLVSADNGSILELSQGLARRIVAWNWTDLMGEPLPQPYGRPDVLQGLSVDELFWLARQPEEGLVARKNGFAPSVNT